MIIIIIGLYYVERMKMDQREEEKLKKTEAPENEIEEDDEDEMPPGQKFIQICISTGLLILAYFICKKQSLPLWAQLCLYLVPYLASGYDVIREAIEDICHGEAMDEDFLMTVSTIGALLIGFVPGGKPMFPEAVFVMLFFQVGEFFEGLAEGNSSRAISQLIDIRPDWANVERDGQVIKVSPEEVKAGEIIVIRPGEKIPVDGLIIDGSTSLDTVALTGESAPRDASKGDQVLSGCVNISGLIRVRVEKVFAESTAAKILDLVKNAGKAKSRSERFISRFARVYTPVVVLAAAFLGLVIPGIYGVCTGTGYIANFASWFLRALTFLIVSCPCALVVSVPLAFFGGIGAASKNGILVKGSSFMDALSKTDIVVFDKTGTLTRGVFEVTSIHPDRIPAKELLHLAAHVERYSTHPIAASIRAAFGDEDDGCKVSEVKEIPGRGVQARVNGRTVCLGNERMMDECGAAWKSCQDAGTMIHVAIDNEYAGHIHISDVIKADAADTILELRELGVRKTVMLTGDKKDVAELVAKETGIDEYRAELLPPDKVSSLERLLSEKEKGRSLAFVGDGINDAPVLARADVGIAMGAMGSDAAIEAADVVLMDDKPSKIARGIKISRRTIRIAKENIVIAIAVKVAILVLAAIGLAPMWLAVFGDTGVLLICIANSARTLSYKAGRKGS